MRDEGFVGRPHVGPEAGQPSIRRDSIDRQCPLARAGSGIWGILYRIKNRTALENAPKLHEKGVP
jgi:hypothetical protein